MEKAKEKKEDDSDNEEEVVEEDEFVRDINEDDITFPDSLGTSIFITIKDVIISQKGHQCRINVKLLCQAAMLKQKK